MSLKNAPTSSAETWALKAMASDAAAYLPPITYFLECLDYEIQIISPLLISFSLQCPKYTIDLKWLS